MTSFRQKVLVSLERIEKKLEGIPPGSQLGLLIEKTLDTNTIARGLAAVVGALLDATKLIPTAIEDGTTAILKKLEDVLKKEDRLMATADEILADVQDEATVVGSVETLLTNLSALIAAAGTDPVKLQAIRDQIDQNKARLTAAVVANTPAATPAP